MEFLPPDGMRKSAIVILAAFLSACLSAGCRNGSVKPGDGFVLGDSRPLMPADRRPAGDKGKYVLLIRLQMASIEVPVGAASASEEIWSYLDEEAVRTFSSASLGLNGLRIGWGRENTWPDMARVLGRLTGRKLRESTTLALPGNPVPIILKKQGQQTIFTFYDDRTMSGSDYPAGENILAVSFTLDQDDPSKIVVTGVPQITSEHRETKIAMDELGLRMVERPNIYTFQPLTFQVQIPSGDYILIGPGGQSRRPSSVGNSFLLKTKEGMLFETVLVLKPQVYAAPAQDVQPGG